MRCLLTLSCVLLVAAVPCAGGSTITEATIVLEQHAQDPVGQNAARVLIEEVEKRTSLRWTVGTGDENAFTIVLQANRPEPDAHAIQQGNEERFAIRSTAPDTLRLEAEVPHALLFAIGYLLQRAECTPGAFKIDNSLLPHETTPHYPLRGHQLGYRARANSYDAWDDARYEQYIRDLALFGTNAIENIPFQDDQFSPHMFLSRRDMNRRMSEICAQYGLQYWVWTPAEFHLDDSEKRAALLAEHEQLYEDCPRIDGVFFPGGDPGENPPELVIPFLEELSRTLLARHPHAKIWLSLQWFNAPQIEQIHTWIDEEQPAWLGGLVGGPSTPPLKSIRERLHKRYPLRDYPDITHTTRCQYPVPWWDPAFALTLGRECINPRPKFYADVIRALLPVTNGFISYSDGCHDNVNKAVWSMLGMNPEASLEDVLRGYATVYFGHTHAKGVAEGILMLEKNWDGALRSNGQIEKTLEHWHRLEELEPRLASEWRGQMLLVRAEYDAYTRLRREAEQAHEAKWNESAIELLSSTDGEPGTLPDRLNALGEQINQKAEFPGQAELRQKIEQRFHTLFSQIGLQTSVPLHNASAPERGCSLDFIDYPLNNRWWISDELGKVQALSDQEAQRARVLEMATWEDAGGGGFYDACGIPGKSPRVDRSVEKEAYPDLEHSVLPTQWWWDQGLSRQRLTWQTSMDWPTALNYTELEANAEYILRCTGYGEALPIADGENLSPTRYGKEIGEIKEFPVPQELTRDGRLTITWRRPPNEDHLNWRQQSRVSEVWLLKR